MEFVASGLIQMGSWLGVPGSELIGTIYDGNAARKDLKEANNNVRMSAKEKKRNEKLAKFFQEHVEWEKNNGGDPQKIADLQKTLQGCQTALENKEKKLKVVKKELWNKRIEHVSEFVPVPGAWPIAKVGTSISTAYTRWKNGQPLTKEEKTIIGAVPVLVGGVSYIAYFRPDHMDWVLKQVSWSAEKLEELKSAIQHYSYSTYQVVQEVARQALSNVIS